MLKVKCLEMRLSWMIPTSNNGGPYKTEEEAQHTQGRRPRGDRGRGRGDAGRCLGPQELQEVGRPLPGAPRGCPALPAPGFRTSASRAGREQVPVASSPQSVGLGYSGPRTLVLGGAQKHPGSVWRHMGAWSWAWVKLEGPPHPAGAATRDCSSQGCPCHFPHSQGGLHPSWGPGHTVCLPGGWEGGSGLPQGSPSPWWCWAGGASFRDPISGSGQQHFPKPWAHPEAPRGASTHQGSVRVSDSGLGAFLPGRRASGSRNSGIQDPPSLRTLLPEGSAANEWENG